MSRSTEKTTFEQALIDTDELVVDILESKSRGFSLMSKYLAKSKGKGVRARLLLNSAMDADGLIRKDSIKVAAAIEILHMATLVHDDVIDNAPIRRGQDSLHVKFGKKEAIICGDYLLSVALTLVTDLIMDDHIKHSRYITSITKALKRVCEGEYRQLIHNGDVNITLRDYFSIISGKTAALFYVSAFCGALMGDCDEKEVKSLSKFGKYLGIIFQVADDCKDYEFSEKQAGKPVKSDLIEGVVTLPLIIAIRQNPELKHYAKNVMLNLADPALLVNEIINNGAIADTKAYMLRFRKKAEAAIVSLDNPEKKKQLINMMNDILKI